MTQKHIPVLADETLELLVPQKGENYLDLTAGYGGHASLVLQNTGNYSESVLVDRDSEAVSYLSDLFKEKQVSILNQPFEKACKQLLEEEKTFDIILADLGLSSPHLDTASRGFSFKHEGPLDMRMDQRSGVTAADIVNSWPETDIARILKEYGEEHRAGAVASAIIAARPFKSTIELANAIESRIGWRTKGHHPATKTFQALRIAVNGELDMLESSLPMMLKLLAPAGRLGIITFHSLEDRIVKRIFADVCSIGYDAEYSLLTKKPVVATHHEIVFNPRARSAKLRALVKIKTERAG